MAPKTLFLLPVLTPLAFAWGSDQDLYIRDAVPDLDPYAMEAALRRRAMIARQSQAAKVKRSMGRMVLSRQINARSAKAAPQPAPVAEADPEDHSFQQYDAGLFRRDGSVLPRDPYAFPTPEPVADPEMWFEGGELHAKRERILNAKRAALQQKKRSLFAQKAEIAKREAEAEAAANANPEAVAEAEALAEAELEVEKREATGSWFSWMKFW